MTGDDAAGGELIVMTDGKETSATYIREVRQTVLDKKVVVHSVLYTTDVAPETHDLSTLARDTGGKEIFLKGQDQTDLLNAFNMFFKCTDVNTLCSKSSQVSIFKDI